MPHAKSEIGRHTITIEAVLETSNSGLNDGYSIVETVTADIIDSIFPALETTIFSVDSEAYYSTNFTLPTLWNNESFPYEFSLNSAPDFVSFKNNMITISNH